MRHGKLLMLMTALASGSGAAQAQTSPVPGSMPVQVLQPPPAVHRPIPVGPGRHFVPPRPRGWFWGRPGWWGGSFQPPMRGFILPSFWLSPDYVVPDWQGYGFAEPGRGRRWVRYYDDAVLVDGRGMIYDSVHDVPWGRYSSGPVPAYVGDAPDSAPPYGARYDYGYDDDEVTWEGGSARRDRQIWAWPNQTMSAQGGTVVMVPPGATTTIVIQPQPIVTTTTVSYQDAAPAWKVKTRAKAQPPASPPPRVIGRVPIKKG